MSRSLYLLKSTPLTAGTPSGTGSEGLRTASVERDGACGLRALFSLLSAMAVCFADFWLGNVLTRGSRTRKCVRDLKTRSSKQVLIHFCK